jgi:hypothetical protein
MSIFPIKNESNFHSGLTYVLDKINSNKSFINTFPEIEDDILTLFNAERITIYQRTIKQHDIYSLYKTGSELNEIRVPMNTQSLSGYVSVSQKSIIVNDVYDSRELASIHPSLKFNPRFDHLSQYRTKSMLTVPIKNEAVLLGVLQLINCTNADHFDNQQLDNAKLFAKFLGQKFRWDIGGYQSPFDYLIHKDIISQHQLERWQLEEKTTNEIIRAIRVNCHVTSDHLGMSLALFYQVPFVKYAPDIYHLHPRAENINISYLKKNHMVLLEDNTGKALLLMNTPNDASKLMEIENIIQQCPYEINVGFKVDIFS